MGEPEDDAMTQSMAQQGIPDAIYEEARELFEDDFRVRDLAKILHEKANAEFERDLMVGALKGLLDALPPTTNCNDFHHSTKDCHSLAETCPPMIRYELAEDEARSALQRVGSGLTEGEPNVTCRP